MNKQHLPIVLIIFDGWGYREESQSNAIALANTPHWDQLWQQYPHTLVSGSGHEVGLPPGQMGNSEVGHLNIGAGRVVHQDYSRIQAAIEDGNFNTNPIFVDTLKSAAENEKAIHIFGLLSPGGVHSHQDHLQAMLQLAAQHNVNKLYLHAFLDGRDTPPQSAQASIDKIETQLQQLGCGQFASLCGRYYAMDRDQRWERTQAAYDLIAAGTAAFHASDATGALQMAYARGETDEFVQATAIHPQEANPVTIEDGDSVIFMNFRADRARQLSRAFTESHFQGFTRKKAVKLAHFVSLTQYAADINTEAAFTPVQSKNVLGEYLAEQGFTQLRIAETEKYAHVTFFFNGGIEQPFANEERILIPSPKVATYDLQPQMSAPELTDKLVTAIESKTYDVIICNYANADMVGHTGKLDAAIVAIETLDDCLGRVITALQKVDGELLVTADHGNAELMQNKETGQAHTAHTSEPVPFVYMGRPATITSNDGILSDIAPSLLHVMGLPQPTEMTGTPLFKLTQ